MKVETRLTNVSKVTDFKSGVKARIGLTMRTYKYVIEVIEYKYWSDSTLEAICHTQV